MHSESVLNSSYVDDVIETSKEVLAGLKMMLTFLSRATCPSSFTFFLYNSHTTICLLPWSKKYLQDFFKKFKDLAIPWRHDLWEQIEHITAIFDNTQGTCCLKKSLLY